MVFNGQNVVAIVPVFVGNLWFLAVNGSQRLFVEYFLHVLTDVLISTVKIH